MHRKACLGGNRVLCQPHRRIGSRVLDRRQCLVRRLLRPGRGRRVPVVAVSASGCRRPPRTGLLDADQAPRSPRRLRPSGTDDRLHRRAVVLGLGQFGTFGE